MSFLGRQVETIWFYCSFWGLEWPCWATRQGQKEEWGSVKLRRWYPVTSAGCLSDRSLCDPKGDCDLMSQAVKIFHWGVCDFLPKNLSKFKLCFPTLAFSLSAESKKCASLNAWGCPIWGRWKRFFWAFVYVVRAFGNLQALARGPGVRPIVDWPFFPFLHIRFINDEILNTCQADTCP